MNEIFFTLTPVFLTIIIVFLVKIDMKLEQLLTKKDKENGRTF